MASNDSVEVSAPSVDEAVIIGLTRLAALRDEVEIEVIDEGSRGFLGLGARQARVRLTRVPKGERAAPTSDRSPRPDSAAQVGVPKAEPTPAEPPAQILSAPEKAPEGNAAPTKPDITLSVPHAQRGGEEQRAAAATEDAAPPHERPVEPDSLDRSAIESSVRDILAHILPGLSIDIELEWLEEDRPTIWVALTGRDANSLVGPRARNLQSLQYLFRSLIYKRIDGKYNVVVDADGYRRRRRRSLESLAKRRADEAVEKGQPVRLRAMPAHERRIIHVVLKSDSRVSTESSGRGRDRAVTITPTATSGRRRS